MPNLLTRDDTFFGVCEGLSEDLGIHSNWLRAGLALGLFFSPTGAIAAYGAMAVVVVFTRVIIPNPRRAAQPVPVEAESVSEAPAVAEAPIEAVAESKAEAADQGVPLAA